MNIPTQPVSPAPQVLAGLGQALRWLRERQSRKQYRVADSAGITKGMLSAYETGRQRPSLETLEKLLDTLCCDLNDLHNALQIVNGRPDQIKAWRAWQAAGLVGMAPLSSGPPAAAGGAGGIGGAAGVGGFAGSYGASPWTTGDVNGMVQERSVEDRAAGVFRDTGAYPAMSGMGLQEPDAGLGGRGGSPSRHAGEAATLGVPPTSADAERMGRASGSIHAGGPGGDRYRMEENSGIANSPQGQVPGAGRPAATGTPTTADLYKVLGADAPRLPTDAEQAFGLMLDGFHNLLRYWSGSLQAPGAAAPSPAAQATDSLASRGQREPVSAKEETAARRDEEPTEEGGGSTDKRGAKDPKRR